MIEALAAHFGGNKAEAGRMLNVVLETIMHETARNEKVGIAGFGVFETVRREARMVRNPRTGERTRADATRIVRFRPGADLKAYVAGERELPPVSTDPTTGPKGKMRPGRTKGQSSG